MKIKLSLEPEPTKVGQDQCAVPKQDELPAKIRDLNRTHSVSTEWPKCPRYNKNHLALHKKNQSQKNHNMNKKKKQSNNTNTKMNQMLELSVRDHKTAIIKMLQ